MSKVARKGRQESHLAKVGLGVRWGQPISKFKRVAPVNARKLRSKSNDADLYEKCKSGIGEYK